MRIPQSGWLQSEPAERCFTVAVYFFLLTVTGIASNRIEPAWWTWGFAIMSTLVPLGIALVFLISGRWHGPREREAANR